MGESRVTPTLRCLVLDVDGVLTDGRIYWTDDGQSSRAFHVLDGFAMRWFQRLGGLIVLCSGKSSEAVAARARELKVDHVIQGSSDKVADLEALFVRIAVRWDEVAMVGDDLPDLPVMRRCAWSVAVANAVPEVHAAARYVTTRAGGAGAVREALEQLLRADGRWREVLAHYGAALPAS